MRGGMQDERREGGAEARRRIQRPGLGPGWRGWGAGHAAERAQNMSSMDLTRDVSRLSGWLNADASCRVERRAYDAGRGAGREAGAQCDGGGACSVQGMVSTGVVGAQCTRQSARRTCPPWL